ncbi:MAG TPA: UDP-N-acetylmuramoyl-tripeptide--D-alanyl-D-alanine ligase [Bryobacteraceae bacterium]|jgi:UDP-N-acetylmuramoyl-tripeptide--D-alanyl-D-alanine ligase
MQFSLAQVREATEGRLLDACPDSYARGYGIDSRTVNPGDLFFAIQGATDGHRFCSAAIERGAIACVVSNETITGPRLIVPDTLTALHRTAYTARELWNRPVVAVTGSAGKTSTKDIIAEFLGVHLRVSKTIGNFNNHLGLPLTLLRIPEDAEVAVVELGMNHSGEIRLLTSLAAPQFGVVTNVGFAHVEFFDSIEGVAAAKRELIEGLAPGGTAILNADDERVLRFREIHSGPVVTYGFSPHADIRAADVNIHPGGVEFSVNGVPFRSSLSGRHGISNILAGLAVAGLFQIGLPELVETVAQLLPGNMRGERSVWQGITLLNDSYNSNPEAARNMLDILCAEPAKRKIAVLGEMLELGRMTEQLHRELGAYAARAGVDILIGVQGAAEFLVEEANACGLADYAVFFFPESEQAGAFLRTFAKPGDAILFKGSRGAHLELALHKLTQDTQDETKL